MHTLRYSSSSGSSSVAMTRSLRPAIAPGESPDCARHSTKSVIVSSRPGPTAVQAVNVLPAHSERQVLLYDQWKQAQPAETLLARLAVCRLRGLTRATTACLAAFPVALGCIPASVVLRCASGTRSHADPDPDPDRAAHLRLR